jgi:hypothetical protein
MSGALQAVYRNLRSFGAMIVQVRAIFWGGRYVAGVATCNLISTSGVIASDTTTAGSNKIGGAGAGYGGDKGIFGYGADPVSGLITPTTNLVSNTGVVAAAISYAGFYSVQDTCAANYGIDKAFFQGGRGGDFGATNMLSLVTNTGVVASQTNAGGTLYGHAATGYGTDTAITLFGGFTFTCNSTCPPEEIFTADRQTYKVSNTGVFTYVSATAALPKAYAGAARYGVDKAISVCGTTASGGYYLPSGYGTTRNLISNTGVVAAESATLATGKSYVTGVKFGADKAIIAFGGSATSGATGTKNYNTISNTGTVASDSVSAVGVSGRPYTPSATQFG